MAQFVEKKYHTGNPQDDYNHIENGYPIQALKDEANYILEGQDEYNGTYLVTKKPDGETVTKTTDFLEFARTREKVLVIHKEGTYCRYNFDFASQFPRQD